MTALSCTRRGSSCCAASLGKVALGMLDDDLDGCVVARSNDSERLREITQTPGRR